MQDLTWFQDDYGLKAGEEEEAGDEDQDEEGTSDEEEDGKEDRDEDKT